MCWLRCFSKWILLFLSRAGPLCLWTCWGVLTADCRDRSSSWSSRAAQSPLDLQSGGSVECASQGVSMRSWQMRCTLQILRERSVSAESRPLQLACFWHPRQLLVPPWHAMGRGVSATHRQAFSTECQTSLWLEQLLTAPEFGCVQADDFKAESNAISKFMRNPPSPKGTNVLPQKWKLLPES